MEFHIQPHDGLWLVWRNGTPVFSGDYRRVEDWLDRAENRAGCTLRARLTSGASGQTLPPRGNGDFHPMLVDHARKSAH